MAFDITKYIVLASISINSTATTDIIVEKYQYDGGEVRVKLCKEVRKANGTSIKSNDVGGIDATLLPQIANAMVAMA